MSEPAELITEVAVAGAVIALAVIGLAQVAGIERPIREPLPPVGPAHYRHPEPFQQEHP